MSSGIRHGRCDGRVTTMEVMRTTSCPTVPPLTRRSLIIEGDFLILSSLRETLVAAGFEVHCAAGPGEARRLLDRYSYEFVVVHLDLNAPAGDAGRDVIAQARKRNPASRIVALGRQDLATRRAPFDAPGADECCPTGGSIDRLRVQIARMARTAGTPAPRQESQS
jgi:DNA-binding response OmpR family regulator